MGDWDTVFDETYLQTYGPLEDEERNREQALAAVTLAEVEPGAEILDCPCGFGRHALPLAESGYVVTGFDRSASQLAEAERRRGRRGVAEARSWRLSASCRSPMRASTPCFTMFSSLGYLERDEDVSVMRELRRVLRPGRTLIVETAHRDALARSLWSPRTWDRLPDGSLYLEERTTDWSAGTTSTYRVIVTPDGDRIERPYVIHVYSAKEWLEMLREAGFEDVEAFGAWDGVTPIGPDVWRLILRAR